MQNISSFSFHLANPVLSEPNFARPPLLTAENTTGDICCSKASAHCVGLLALRARTLSGTAERAVTSSSSSELAGLSEGGLLRPSLLKGKTHSKIAVAQVETLFLAVESPNVIRFRKCSTFYFA